MLFDIPFIADWKKIGEHMQPTDHSTDRENKSWLDYDYQGGQKVLVRNNGILQKAEFGYLREPRRITSIHMNGTRKQIRKDEYPESNLNPFDDDTNILNK
jgi:hypothetical protein